MKFGPLPVDEAVGHVLAHGHRIEGRKLRKGALLSAEEAEGLRSAGVDRVVVARLEEGDVREGPAAEALARAAAGPGLRIRGPFTGRANLVAEGAGLVLVDPDVVRRANGVDEALTLATLPPYAPVREGQLVATAKVIPLAVPSALLERATSVLGEGAPALRLAPFRALRGGLVLTELPGTPEGSLDRSREVLDERMRSLGSTLAEVDRCAHDPDAVSGVIGRMAAAGLSPVLVLGASAVVDRDDVVPAAVRAAGGDVDRLGLPVDPGNLLMTGRVGDSVVIGVPGCARSPKRNGFDLVLERVAAGLPLDPGEMADLGVGGLMAEIPTRPQPREDPGAGDAGEGERTVAGVVLAAGRSSRMGEVNKLVARVGRRTLVESAVDTALGCGLAPVLVVTGRGADEVREALAGRPVRFVHNPDPGRGMASSLSLGVGTLVEEGEVEGAVILLGDMPRVAPGTVRALLDAFDPEAGRAVCVPVHERKRGNPVLWAASLLPELGALEGDTGGRSLLGRYSEVVHEVEVDDPGVLLDVDTPEALRALRERAVPIEEPGLGGGEER